MKLSFSTRGWPELSWQDVLNDAVICGFSGVEIYHVSAAPDLTDKGGPFHKYSIASTCRTMREKQVTLVCFDSSRDITTTDEAGLDELRNEMQLASDLRAPYVAVWASGEEEEDIRAAEANLKALIPQAEALGTTILIKTCGLFASTERLRALLDRFACDQIAVLWDVHHPYRDWDESPAETITNLGGE